MHEVQDEWSHSKYDRRGVVCFRVLWRFCAGDLVVDVDVPDDRLVILRVTIRRVLFVLSDDDCGDLRLEADTVAFAMFCFKMAMMVSPSRRRPLNS